ncbi:PKS-like enzyme [Aspergillus arachidicola]|uniref:PKS-like enzyme n=1 Tax=Aspergillus arachidicola TaxID=656916 RepID=A0A2G7G1P4_9EURO|nr:PKS-like enzyme [Aspergillus arachidicola]
MAGLKSFLTDNPSSSPIAAETSSRSPSPVERVSPFEDKVHVTPISSQGSDTMEQIQTVRQATSVVLQGSPKTCSRTLFLLPDGSGSATSYASIPRIDKDICVIALNSPYIKDPSKLSHCSLGDLIKGYLNELRRRRPTGPYHLGGWSAGGILAYRLAQILGDEGEEVHSLILIDSPPPRGLDRLPQHFYEMCDSLNIFGKLGKKSNVEDSKRRAPKKPDWLIPHFNGVIDLLHNYWAEPLMDSQCLKVSLIWACGSIMDDANLPPLMPHKDDTEGMKFLTEKRRDFSGNGWEDLFPGSKLVIEKAHGANHFSMMQGPFVIKLAQFIRKAMC